MILPNRIVMPSQAFQDLKDVVAWMSAIPENFEPGDRLFEKVNEYQDDLLEPAIQFALGIEDIDWYIEELEVTEGGNLSAVLHVYPLDEDEAESEVLITS